MTKECDFLTANGLELSIVRSIYYKNDSRWNYNVNLYPYNTLYFIMNGDGFVQIGENVVSLEPGHAYLIPQNTMFRCFCKTNIEKLYIDFNIETVPGCDIFADLNEIRITPVPMEIIMELIKSNDGDSLKSQLYFEGELQRILSQFVDDSMKVKNEKVFIYKEILNDISNHLSARIRIEEVAKKHGFNPVVLSRNFKKVFKCSLKNYVEKMLVNRIKRDLLLTSKSIKEIAADYEFYDQYYFSAFFKRREGISPTKYKKENIHHHLN